MKATLIKSSHPEGGHHYKVYKLDPPFTWTDWMDEEKQSTEYVLVSAANVPFSGPETYIFASKEDGEVTDWGELDGSYKGGLSHRRAITGMGYSIEGDED